MWKCLGNNVAMKWIGANPRKSASIGFLMGLPVMDFYLKRKAKQELESSIYEKLVKGTKPVVPLDQKLPQRVPQVFRHETNSIKDLMIPARDEVQTRFGVVIGPSGSGKTHIVTKLCNENHEGVIYYEILIPNSFLLGVSEAIGMKTRPATFLDLALGYVSEHYKHYHTLPKCQLSGIGVVFSLLQKVSARYIANYGRVPVFFIDGVDQLAKHDPELCARLVTLSKVLANNNTVKIVLVSSEGTIMPLLEKLSATNRAIVLEVGDLNDDQAISYLMNNQIAEDVARKLVEWIGGRIVNLQSCVWLIQRNNWSNDELHKKIKETLFMRVLNNQKMVIEREKPESFTIIEQISKKGYALPGELMAYAKNKEKMEQALTKMIAANILRYNVQGSVTWHGKIQKSEFGED